MKDQPSNLVFPAWLCFSLGQLPLQTLHGFKPCTSSLLLVSVSWTPLQTLSSAGPSWSRTHVLVNSWSKEKGGKNFEVWVSKCPYFACTLFAAVTTTTLKAHGTKVVSFRSEGQRSEVDPQSWFPWNSSRGQSIFSSIPASRKHLHPLACGSLPVSTDPVLSNLFLPVLLLHLHIVLPLEKLRANRIPDLVVYVAWEIFRISFWLFNPQWISRCKNFLLILMRLSRHLIYEKIMLFSSEKCCRNVISFLSPPHFSFILKLLYLKSGLLNGPPIFYHSVISYLWAISSTLSSNSSTDFFVCFCCYIFTFREFCLVLLCCLTGWFIVVVAFVKTTLFLFYGYSICCVYLRIWITAMFVVLCVSFYFQILICSLSCFFILKFTFIHLGWFLSLSFLFGAFLNCVVILGLMGHLGRRPWEAQWDFYVWR